MYLLIAITVLLLTLLVYLISRRPVCTGKKAGKVRAPIEQVLLRPELVKYEVKDLSTPKLVGYPLKLLLRIVYTLLGRNILVPFMISKSNLNLLNGEYIPELPTLYPQFPLPSKENRAEVNRKALQDIVAGYSGKCNHRCTSLDYHQAYKSGQCTPLDVARAVLNAVSSSNKRTPPLRAVIETNDKFTLKLAEASTERWREGKPLSLIDGVPIAIKAEIKLEPFSFRGGAIFKPVCSNITNDAVVVRKLVDAGAVMIGLTNMQELGTGTFGSNPHKEYLTARNPHNEKCYCGGSSSGSAAAVAAGLCPLALGGDGGGSIRIPASTCGVIGLKPTFRLLDTTGFLPQSFSVCVGGPICSSTIDTAIAMSVMCPEGVDLEGFGFQDLKGVRVGVYKEFFEHADLEIVSLCKKAIDILVSLGAEVKEIVIPELEEIRVAHIVTISSEMLSALAVDVDKNFDKISSETLIVMSFAQRTTAKDFINAQKQRTRSIIALQSIFKEVDIIATPSTGVVAPIIPAGADKFGYGDGELAGRMMRFSCLANLTGIPGISVPVGLTADGLLPVGLQLQSHWYNEGGLLRVAYALEKQVSLSMTKPSIYYDILDQFCK